MLQTMRQNAQGTIAKVIVGLIVVVFALFGVESIVSLGGGERPVVTVGDYEIMQADVQQKIAQQKDQLRRQFGEQYDESLFNDQFLRESALEQLINERVAQSQAMSLGFRAAPSLIDEVLLGTPAFQKDGKFDAEQFKTILRINNLSVLGYRNMIASTIEQNQARAGFMLSAFSTPFEVQQQQALDNEVREYRYKLVNADDMKSQVTLTDAEIEQSYQDNISRFQNPEQVSIRYIHLSKALPDINNAISDDEINAAYSDYVAEQEAKEQREVSHILFEVNDDRSEADAIALAETARQRIQSGESFASVAADMSDDVGSKQEGGSLGIVARGSFAQAFDDALFSLNEGDFSTPVVTEFGVHVIRADKVVPADIKSLAEVRSELIEEFARQESEARYAEQVQELSNVAFSARDINDVASAMSLPVQDTPLFSANSSPEGVAASSDIRRVAFEDNMKLDREVSQVIETPSGAVVFEVADFREANAKPLEEVRAQVVKTLTREKSLALAKQEAESLATADKSSWTSVSGRLKDESTAAPAVQKSAFALAEGAFTTVATPNGYVALNLDTVQKQDWTTMPLNEETDTALESADARSDMIAYQAWSKANTKIER
ncbi:MAG: SurA N-terminal domain-containing protein [Oleibacter sp.]|nr:SurA N-terminal domain-containing protein [Thalassolituus sp.]